MSFSDAEIAYLTSQNIGRLATVAPDGTVQNSPVMFTYNGELGTVDIGGHGMGASRKFRNIEGGGVQVAFVIDEIGFQPFWVKGIEIRGRAEALRDQPPPAEGFSPELIRIHPQTTFSWQVEPDTEGHQKKVWTATA